MELALWNWTGKEMGRMKNSQSGVIQQLYMAILWSIHHRISQKMLRDAMKAGCDGCDGLD